MPIILPITVGSWYRYAGVHVTITLQKCMAWYIEHIYNCTQNALASIFPQHKVLFHTDFDRYCISLQLMPLSPSHNNRYPIFYLQNIRRARRCRPAVRLRR